MCEFCVKHGEGKKWYLQAKNYSNDLLSDTKRYKLTKDAGYWINDLYHVKYRLLKFLPLKVPLIGSLLKGIIKHYFLDMHWGQVIPIEDVEKILSMTNSITRIPCICRHLMTGKERRVCFLISLDPSEMGMADIVDQSFFGGPDVARFEKVEKKWTIDFINKSEAEGLIHSIWTFKSPFIGALCNCRYSEGCLSLKMYKEATPIMFRAEYVVSVDINKCISCQQCIKVCQFGAIEFDKKNKKIKIGEKKCVGCGICRNVCKTNAITLRDRASVPEVMHLW